MKKRQSLKSLVFFVVVCGLMESNWSATTISNIALSPRSSLLLKGYDEIHLSFAYSTDHPGGIALSVTPLTHNAQTPGGQVTGLNANYLAGMGQDTAVVGIDINSPDGSMDSIRIQAHTPTVPDTVLFQATVPAQDQFLSNYLDSVYTTPASPDSLVDGELMVVHYKFATYHIGVKRYVHPYGPVGWGPGAIGGAVVSGGVGKDSAAFTNTAGDIRVDSVLMQMFNEAGDTLLYQTTVPVNLTSVQYAVFGVNSSLAHSSTLLNGESVPLQINYGAFHTGGVRILALPFTAGSQTPNSYHSASPIVASGRGIDSANFTVLAGTATVDSLEILLYTPGIDTVLWQTFQPIHYSFVPHFFPDVQVPPSPQHFRLIDSIPVNFAYGTTQSGGVLIAATPFFHGAADSSAWNVPAPFDSGRGSGRVFCGLLAADSVDFIRLEMTNRTGDAVLLQAFFPVSYAFSNTVGLRPVDAQSPWLRVAGISTQEILFRYFLPRAASLALDIFDAGGRKAAELRRQSPAGVQTLALPRSGGNSSLAAGNYWARLTVEGRIFSLPFTAP